MKHTVKIISLLATLLSFAACDKPETPVNGGEDNSPKERVIIYDVNGNENRQTLETEAEWDALLEQFCNQAMDGSTVTFYNIESRYSLPPTKEAPSITTTNRDELKEWMKSMEKEGLTVRVTYDNQSGVWHGEAYATAPASNTSGTIIGTWRFSCMVVTHVGSDGILINSDLYTTEESGGSWYYTFSENGTLTITVNGMDGTTATDSGTWSLSADGVLCSELLPSGACWDVNWITPQTLIMSSADLGTEEGDIYYQIQFESVTSAE